MIWLAASLFIALAIALYVAREPMARGQALVLGGRMGPGCVIAEAIVLIVLAVVVVIFRDLLR